MVRRKRKTPVRQVMTGQETPEEAGQETPQTLEDLAIYAAPAVFVVLWASGFIGANWGSPMRSR
jgi:hypothetical protein